jgi:hypothetical protein
MSEPSDGIAEEVERQLQFALAAAAVAARRASAARQNQHEQAQRESAQTAQAVRAQIEAERRLAAAHLQPVFDPGWWETAAPREIADMWQQANSWRGPDRDVSTPTIFDRAAGRIGQEVGDRTGLDVTQRYWPSPRCNSSSARTRQRLPNRTLAATQLRSRLARATRPHHARLTIHSVARSYANGSRPSASPSRRSTREHSPTSAKPERPPRPHTRTPQRGPRPDRGPTAARNAGRELHRQR